MKLRTLGVALLASCGLAVAALPATAALATGDAPLFSDGSSADPYPPSKTCGGLFGTLQVSQTVVASGSPLTYAGCGFVPGSVVALNTSGGTPPLVDTPSGLAAISTSVVADGGGYITGSLTLTDIGINTITATGPGYPAAGILDKEELDPAFKDKGGLFDDKNTLAATPINRTLTASVEVVAEGTPITGTPGLVGGVDGVGGILGPGVGGIGGVIPIPIPIPIDGWDDKDKNKDCFKDGKDGRKDGLADAIDDKDGKDGVRKDDKDAVNKDDKDGRDHKDGKDDGLFGDKDRRCDDVGVGGVGVGVVGVGVAGAGVGGATPAGGALPFTGVETGAMASIAFALLGGGLLLRVAARRRRNTLGANLEG